jgi:predicted nucleic acid-binding protein
MRQFIADGERLAVPSFVFYEFLRGPRRPEEMWTLNHRDFADIPGLRLVEPGNSGRR